MMNNLRPTELGAALSGNEHPPAQPGSNVFHAVIANRACDLAQRPNVCRSAAVGVEGLSRSWKAESNRAACLPVYLGFLPDWIFLQFRGARRIAESKNSTFDGISQSSAVYGAKDKVQRRR